MCDSSLFQSKVNETACQRGRLFDKISVTFRVWGLGLTNSYTLKAVVRHREETTGEVGHQPLDRLEAQRLGSVSHAMTTMLVFERRPKKTAAKLVPKF